MADVREDQILRIPLWKSDQSTWPKHVRPVAVVEADNLGVDRLGNLYWAGKPVVVKRIALSTGKRSWDIFIALIALLASISIIAQGTATTHTWLCGLGYSLILRCPSP